MKNIDATLEKLYGKNALTAQRERYQNAEKAFEELFGDAANAMIFSASGRTEIGGNHTDHNRGKFRTVGNCSRKALP